MLQTISIQNFALIEKLEIDFHPGHSIITGETGAGKSILLGALSLILGQRADTSTLRNKESRCVIEGIFRIEKYHLKDYFNNNYPEIDYSHTTIIRRLINPNGSSRAFVNDTPVNLTVLKDIGERLVDIHSQHKNLALSENVFQLKVVDTLAKNNELVASYKKAFLKYKDSKKELELFIENAKNTKSDLDYFQHRFKQLDDANLSPDEQQELEKEQELLSHAEEIKHAYSEVTRKMNCEDTGAITALYAATNAIEQITAYSEAATEIAERIKSAYIDLKDLANETEILADDVDFDKSRTDFINERLTTIYDLQKRHNVNSTEELLLLKEELDTKIQDITSLDFKTENLEKKLKMDYDEALNLANNLAKKRLAVLPKIQNSITKMLKELGMLNAEFKVQHKNTKTLSINGSDELSFLFSANKNGTLQDITKVASGGEISRVMLSLKALISESTALPTIIFDEIDTGVSGDIANKMGNIFHKMGSSMQVMNITHLPQIAAKGDYHYQVYKKDKGENTLTNIKLLSPEERIKVIAQMLSGENITEAALLNAKELLNK